jgi:hypothetical protein
MKHFYVFLDQNIKLSNFLEKDLLLLKDQIDLNNKKGRGATNKYFNYLSLCSYLISFKAKLAGRREKKKKKEKKNLRL